MSIKCRMSGLEVNYPCSAACPLFGDCTAEFNALQKSRVRTNADRMNSMSIEEKAAFIVDEVLDIKHEGMRETAYNAWLKWLQQPVGGADHA